MDPRRALVERNAHFTRGPRFFRESGVVMFEFVIDAGNVLGPRPATEADYEKHGEAAAAFKRADALTELARSDADLLEPAPVLVGRSLADTLPREQEHVHGQPGGQQARRGRKPRRGY